MTTADLPLEPRSKTFGILGVIAGFLGLLSILVGPAIRDAIVPPPPPAKESLVDMVLTVRQLAIAKLSKTPPPPQAPRPRFSPQELPYTLSLAFAAFAIIGGSISYLRREDHRYTYVACGVATVTLFLHAILLAIAAAVFCVILRFVLPPILSHVH